MSEKIIVYKYKMDEEAGGGGFGWIEDWGTEITYKLMVPEIRRDDLVLDWGCGSGRCSVPAAMYGAKIVGVDKIAVTENYFNERYNRLGLGDRVEFHGCTFEDFLARDRRKYKAIIAIGSYIHGEKTTLWNDIPKLASRMQQNGLLVLDVPSISSNEYEANLRYGEQIGPDTFKHKCDCYGPLEEVPLAFYRPGEVETRMMMAGGRIVGSTEMEMFFGSGNYNRVVVAKF
jgi:hypothetical protein